MIYRASVEVKLGEVYESLYQLLIAEDENVVIEDAHLRYGEDAETILNNARKIMEELYKVYENREDIVNVVIRDYGQEIVNTILSRANNIDTVKPIIKYFSKNAHSPASSEEVECLLDLLEIKYSIVDLVRLGILMHVNSDELVVPHYLSIYDDCYVDVENIIDNLSLDYARLAILESVVENVKPNRELFEILYNASPDNYEIYCIDRLMKYCNSVDKLIINPCINISELREIFHNNKQVHARKLFRTIEPGVGHVKYSKKIGALVSYIMLGPGEHGIIMFMPWILPSKRLETFYATSPRIIVTSIPFRKEFSQYFHEYLENVRSFRNTAFLFVQEGVGYLVSPSMRSRSLDSLLDLIYRSNLEIVEF